MTSKKVIVTRGDKQARFNSISDCAKTFNVDEKAIRHRIKTGKNYEGCLFRIDNVEDIKAKNKSNILLLDVETSPTKAWVWNLWKQNIYIDQIINNWYILTWAAKWLNEDEVYSSRLTAKEALEQDDSRIVNELWDLLDEAEVVVAHNGNSFDIPKINTRFILNGFIPPSPFKQIDTKLVAQKQFGFSSNKLEALARNFGIEGKFDTTFELWDRCCNGDDEALEYMREYNTQDVIILEKVYLKLRPYIKGHPNMDIYVDDKNPVCTLCGSTHLNIVEDKSFYTQAVKYQLYRCADCGGLSRAKKGDKFMNKKQISAIPK